MRPSVAPSPRLPGRFCFFCVDRAGRRGGTRGVPAQGFTLVELVTVLVLVGILAVVALPRFFDRHDFDAMGFRDGTKALLRYAQKSAIAQRRTVCVRFTADRAWLTVRNAADDVSCGVQALPGDPVPAGETPLTGPDGRTPFTVAAAPGTGYAPTPAGFHFVAGGQPSAGAVVTVAGSTAITVEAGTGYVH